MSTNEPAADSAAESTADSAAEPAWKSLEKVEDLGLTRLASGLDRYVRNLGAPPISILTQLEDRWPEIVGPGLAASTRPAELLSGVLTIACSDPAGASQIGWMETQIIQRFTTTFNTNMVQRVVGRVDRWVSDTPTPESP